MGESTVRNSEKPETGQCWEINNGNDSLKALIIDKDPYIVQFFDPFARNEFHKLNDLEFEVLPWDFIQRLKEPRFISVGRIRANYVFWTY